MRGQSCSRWGVRAWRRSPLGLLVVLLTTATMLGVLLAVETIRAERGIGYSSYDSPDSYGRRQIEHYVCGPITEGGRTGQACVVLPRAPHGMPPFRLLPLRPPAKISATRGDDKVSELTALVWGDALANYVTLQRQRAADAQLAGYVPARGRT